MKAPIRKPKRWTWYVVTGMMLAGVVLLLAGKSRLAGFLIAAGIGGWLGLDIRDGKYENLSPEERREQDRMDRDERNRMIRERAAWITLQIECWFMTALVVLVSLVLDRRALIEPILWFALGQVLVFEFIQWRLEKKY